MRITISHCLNFAVKNAQYAAVSSFSLCLLSFANMPDASAAENPENGDIRSIKVTTKVSDLETTGFANIRCVDAQTERPVVLLRWSAFTLCKKDTDGFVHLRFDYDDGVQQWGSVNDKWEGTRVAGHPVLLSMRIGPDGRVASLKASTDPKARSYMRKKAFLLSLRVKARYGREGWDCIRQEPTTEEQPVGGMYINESCEKELTDRRIQLHTRLYRMKDQSLKETINSSEFEITAGPS